MPKVISKGKDAQARLLEGVDFYVDSVQPTAGPFGLNWYLEKGDKFTNDGKNIGAELEHSDEIVNRGINAVRKVVIKTNDELGDGSTTTPMLYRAILREAIKKLGTGLAVKGKMTASELRIKLKSEVEDVISRLKTMSEPITSEDELINSALVSVEMPDLAEMIGKMQWELGPDGVIVPEDTNDKTSSIKRVSGIRLDNGLGTSVIINNVERQSLELENCRVIMTNHTIGHGEMLTLVKENVGILDQLSRKGIAKVVIVARAFTQEAVQDCMDNTRAGFGVYPINAPYTNQNEMMKDMVSLVGGSYINNDERALSDIQLSDVGFLKKIVARRFDAIITGKEDEEATKRIETRVEELKTELKGSESEFEKRGLQERMAQLTGGIAVLSVGALSVSERERVMDKVEDCVRAVRLVLQEGVVAGGGKAFKEIADSLPDSYLLKQPLQVLYDQITSSAPEGWVIEDWVKDPVKLLRISLTNATEGALNLACTIGATATETTKPLDQLLRRATQE